MAHYTCRLKNRDGSDDVVDLGDFSVPDEAARAGRSALLVSLTASQMELWRGPEFVTAMDRAVAQFRRRPEPQRARVSPAEDARR